MSTLSELSRGNCSRGISATATTVQERVWFLSVVLFPVSGNCLVATTTQSSSTRVT